MKVEGTVTLVTGGASGLGRGVAESLVAQGGQVVILDLAMSPGAEVAKALGDAAVFVPCDVTAPGEVEDAVSDAAAAFGRLDVLVSCAGISKGERMLQRSGAIHSLEQFRRHIDINLVGLFDVLRHAVAVMAANEPNTEGERGVVINLASIAALEGQLGQAAYASSKAGVVGLTLPLARDLSSVGIRVLTICPGTMDTPMLAGLDTEMVNRLAQANLFPKRLGRPDDVAALVRSIIEQPFLNGEVIRLDAGLRMAPR